VGDDVLPLTYKPELLEAYFKKRPQAVQKRMAQIIQTSGVFMGKVAVDAAMGKVRRRRTVVVVVVVVVIIVVVVVVVVVMMLASTTTTTTTTTTITMDKPYPIILISQPKTTILN